MGGCSCTAHSSAAASTQLSATRCLTQACENAMANGAYAISRRWKNWRLAAAQALTGANSAVIFATGSIVGASLAPDMSLATAPLSMYVLGLAAGTLPTGAISRAYGRRVAFILGTGCGVLTGLLGSRVDGALARTF